MDSDAACALLSTAPHSGSAADAAAGRRRKEEGRWNDLALDQFFDDANSSNSQIASYAPFKISARKLELREE